MKDQKFTIKENNAVAEGIFELVLQADSPIEEVHCGQFVEVSVPSRKDLVLRRPVGIYEFTDNTISVRIQIKGGGTKALAAMKVGEEVDVIYPLGNGFPIADETKRVLIVAGGIGTFPLRSILLEHPNLTYSALLGYRNKNVAVCIEDFENVCERVKVFSDDGSIGTHGFVTDSLLDEINAFKPDVIFACGPTPMFKALQRVLKDCEVPCYISLEERMGCGIGACLVCACQVEEYGEFHSKRVCADGPVFPLKKVKL